MARPFSVSVVASVAANKTTNIILGLRGETLDGPSRLQFFMTRQAVLLQVNILVGGENVIQNGLPQINTVAGTKPAVPDDLLVDTFGFGAEKLIVDGQNLTAGALELRMLLMITPLSDVDLQKVLQMPNTR